MTIYSPLFAIVAAVAVAAVAVAVAVAIVAVAAVAVAVAAVAVAIVAAVAVTVYNIISITISNQFAISDCFHCCRIVTAMTMIIVASATTAAISIDTIVDSA